MSINVQPLASSESAALAVFYNSLSPATIRTFRPLKDKTSADVCRRIAAENEVNPRNRLDLLAFMDEQIVGWAFLSSLSGTQPELGIVVADAIQGRGLGDRLLTQLLKWACDSGISHIYLMVVKDNHRAIHLYQRHGFVIYDDEFDEGDQLPYFHLVVDLSADGRCDGGREGG